MNVEDINQILQTSEIVAVREDTTLYPSCLIFSTPT